MGKPRGRPRNPARDAGMIEMYRQGCTLEQVGQCFGVTRERARQVISRAGVSRTDGGVAIRSVAKRVAADSARDLRYLSRYGMAYDEYRAHVQAGHARLYQRQQKSARSRGIEWRLDFAQWWAIWERSGRWAERGRGNGKYCMSRVNDDGAYEIGNVHIQSFLENSREAVKKWKGQPPKRFRGVFAAYPGLKNGYVAKLGRTVVGYFPSAEEAAMARLSAQLRRELEGAAA